MSSRFTSAIVLGLAIIASPLGASSALAQSSSAAAPTAVSLQPVIVAAARSAASKPGFANLQAPAKLAAVQSSVAAALSASGASPAVIQAALIMAVKSGVISAATAVAIAAGISAEMAAAVASDPAVIAAAGGNLTATAATDAFGGPTVLMSLQGGNGTPTPPAAFDPCAGVVAAYCGG